MQITPELQPRLSSLLKALSGTILETVHLQFVEISKDLIEAEFEVTPALLQPQGLLHGGVSLLVAESLASIAASFNVPAEGMHSVGVDLSAQHLSSITAGTVKVRTVPLHRGKTRQVWQVDLIAKDSGRPLSSIRCGLLNRSRTGI